MGVANAVLRLASDLLKSPSKQRGPSGSTVRHQTRQSARPGAGASTVATREAARRISYAPNPDGDADPGEIVWTWVTFEEDAQQGKDRPVLVVGRDGGDVLALMLTSKETRDGQPGYLPLGVGSWDSQGRPSWIRLDRVLKVAANGIRREGAVLDRARFDRVASALKTGYGWA